ncbi:MAG: hypothetical protein LBS31_03700 [Candidatus Adiutrix sp.]|jgi:hypothetical protein|nr:hypothetical protein [Candidatus Adiutrix sp.]
MTSDTALKHEGMKILLERLGAVEAERFIALMRREPFDYTEWQRNLFGDMPLDEFLKKADEYSKATEA